MANDRDRDPPDADTPGKPVCRLDDLRVLVKALADELDELRVARVSEPKQEPPGFIRRVCENIAGSLIASGISASIGALVAIYFFGR